jgi:hypothetical protein
MENQPMSKARLLLLLFIGFLGGCQLWQEPKKPEQPPTVQPRDYSATDLDSLIRYGEDLTKMTPPERLVECQQVDRMQLSNPRMGYRLHLVLGQMLLDDCGDPGTTLQNINAVTNEITDNRVRSWLVYVGELISRDRKEAATSAELEKQLKVVQSGKHKVHKDVKVRDNKIQTLENEVEELRSKLNALKSIEQKL